MLAAAADGPGRGVIVLWDVICTDAHGVAFADARVDLSPSGRARYRIPRDQWDAIRARSIDVARLARRSIDASPGSGVAANGLPFQVLREGERHAVTFGVALLRYLRPGFY